MGKYPKLTTFTLASDYDPIHYDWTEKELAALGDCKATAEVIKARLEKSGLKVMEMYVIEHTNTDKTKTHFHILVKFELTHGGTKDKIAKYIGVSPNIVETLSRGRRSYDSMLAYLTHIKYKNKIQYAPEDVVTLIGTDYMVHYNKYKESWIKARDIVAKKDGKPLDRRFREAVSKLESGELLCAELAGIPEYRQLFLSAKYQRKLEAAAKRVENLAYHDRARLGDKHKNGEISMEEAKASEEYKLVFKYYKDFHF